MKLKYCLIVAVLLLTNFNLSADEFIAIYLSNSDNSPVRVEVSSVSSIKFNKTQMFVSTDNGSFEDYSFSDIRKITFEKDSTSIKTINANNSVTNIYPNPTKDNLTIDGANEMFGSDVCIYSLTGSLVVQHSQWNGEKIDVSNLNAGVYFVKINSITLKFVKQ